MPDYRELRVWQSAHDLVLEVYRCSDRMPVEERFGLTAQLRSSAASIPANLAEGCGRDSPGELARFSGLSLGSANELEYHLLLARDLGYLEPETHAPLAERTDHVKRMLANLIRSLRAKPRPYADIGRTGQRKTDNG